MSTDDLQTVAWLIEGSRVFVDSVAMTEESARKRIAERGKDSATTAPLVRRSAALSCIEALERENRELRSALTDIANPVAALQRTAEAEGSRLNGVAAITFLDRSTYYIARAKEALASTAQEQTT